MSGKFLIVIAGPTGIGKTKLAIDLAMKFNCKILSADSRQFYKEMNIGTAKPDKAELSMVLHHFIGHLSIHEPYNVGNFETDTLNLLKSIYQVNDLAILVGGSGLYIDAVCEGLDEMPEVSKEIREKLNARLKTEGITLLQNELKALDPEYYQIVDLQNSQRVIRALEVCLTSGKPYSSFRKKKTINRNFEMVRIGLNTDRKRLYDRIDQRVENMIASGLFEEAESFFPFRKLKALQTVGYTEIFDFIENKIDRVECIRLIKQNSRRYAKRQLTWFGKDKKYEWFETEEVAKIEKYILKQIDENKKAQR